MSRAAVVRRLSGEVEFSASEISSIAEITGVNLDALLIADEVTV